MYLVQVRQITHTDHSSAHASLCMMYLVPVKQTTYTDHSSAHASLCMMYMVQVRQITHTNQNLSLGKGLKLISYYNPSQRQSSIYNNIFLLTANTVFYNGDIVLDKEYEKIIYGADEFLQIRLRYKRATTRSNSRLWKDGVVPYVFSDTICKLCSFGKLCLFLFFMISFLCKFN